MIKNTGTNNNLSNDFVLTERQFSGYLKRGDCDDVSNARRMKSSNDGGRPFERRGTNDRA